MSRTPTPRYFKTRDAYYCQWLGRQYRLAVGPKDEPDGPTYLAALDAIKKVLANHTLGKGNEHVVTVDTLMTLYLDHAKRDKASTTHELRTRYCGQFGKEHAGIPVEKIRKYNVRTFVSDPKRAHLAAGTVRVIMSSINAAFQWAADDGLIVANPIARMKQPGAQSRGRKAIIRPEVHQAALARSKPDFRLFLKALHNTGARSGEIRNATANAWNDAIGALEYHPDTSRVDGEFRHKTARTGRVRKIYFTGDMLDEVRQLVKKHPHGPLFRTFRGKAWSQKKIDCRVKTLRKRIDAPCFTSHGYRHTFATEWLMAGRSIDLLASLLGCSPVVLRKHYAHLLDDDATLRTQLESFQSARVPSPPSLPLS